MMSNRDVAIAFSKGAKKGKSNRMFIDGDTIYSYGYHFPLAQRFRKKDVEYLYNPIEYSMTTTHHQSAVLTALNGKTLYIENCDLKNAQKQKENNKRKIEYHRDKLTRARTTKEFHKMKIEFYKKQNELLDLFIGDESEN
jgi:hypothetical protein